jgi:hypothetical protein
MSLSRPKLPRDAVAIPIRIGHVRLLVVAVVIAVACPACVGSGRSSPTAPKQPAVTHPTASRSGHPVLVSIPPVTGQWPGDPPPPVASAPIRLSAPPADIVHTCQGEQSKTTTPVLCPTLVPTPILPGAPGGKVARWQTVLYPGGKGYEISYGQPWEALSGRGWKTHLWRNRPCCFFHFTMEWWTGHHWPDAYYAAPPKKPPEHVAILGGYHGHVYNATIADHVVFLLTRHGVHYDVTEHSFGRGTLQLLSRIVAGLRPVNPR